MRIQSHAKSVVGKAHRLGSASRKLARKASSEARSFFHAKPVLFTLIGCGVAVGLAMIWRPWR